MPNTINGVALGNAGTAVMLIKLSEFYGLDHILKYPFYCFLCWSALLMALYVVKLLIYGREAIKTDFSSPLTVARNGVYCMSWCLIGSVLSTQYIGFPAIFPQIFIIVGELIQLTSMCFFLLLCYKTKTLPEPFFNAAILSCAFPAITLPGSGPYEELRRYCLSVAIVFFVILAPIEVWRTLQSKGGMPIVAKDQSVAMLQSGAATICSAWYVSPLTGSAIEGMGAAIGQLLFSLSTAMIAVTLYAMYQRRFILYQLGFNHPGWSACSFPFANSAIAAGFYLRAHYSGAALAGASASSNLPLEVWVWFLSAAAFAIILAVNAIYFKNLFFMRKLVETSPGTMNGNGTAESETASQTRGDHHLNDSIPDIGCSDVCGDDDSLYGKPADASV
jgi:hypothetical protein